MSYRGDLGTVEIRGALVRSFALGSRPEDSQSPASAGYIGRGIRPVASEPPLSMRQGMQPVAFVLEGVGYRGIRPVA